ncbi:hypothetical protein ABIE33_005623 [Ensifer sp. 4252]
MIAMRCRVEIAAFNGGRADEAPLTLSVEAGGQ